jgi:PKD repeat protein
MLDVLRVMTGSRDSASLDTSFDGGYYYDPIVNTTTGNDSGHVAMGQVSGSLIFITASFTTDTVGGAAPLTVTFTNTSTPDFTSYTWNPSGSLLTASLNTFTYTQSGSYTVALMARSASYSSSVTQSNYIAVT